MHIEWRILVELGNVVHQNMFYGNNDRVERGLQRCVCGIGVVGWKTIHRLQGLVNAFGLCHGWKDRIVQLQLLGIDTHPPTKKPVNSMKSILIDL